MPAVTEESVIARNLITEISVRVPAAPQKCNYVRIVGADGFELIYWDSKEWEDDPAGCIGAVMGAIKQVLGAHQFLDIRKQAEKNGTAAKEANVLNTEE